MGDIPEAMTNTIPIQYHRILFILATIQYLILLVLIGILLILVYQNNTEVPELQGVEQPKSIAPPSTAQTPGPN